MLNHYEIVSTDFRAQPSPAETPKPDSWVAELAAFENSPQSLDGIPALTAAVRRALEARSDLLNLARVPLEALEARLPVEVMDALRQTVERLSLPPLLDADTIQDWVAALPRLRELDAGYALATTGRPLQLTRMGMPLQRVFCKGVDPRTVVCDDATELRAKASPWRKSGSTLSLPQLEDIAEVPEDGVYRATPFRAQPETPSCPPSPSPSLEVRAGTLSQSPPSRVSASDWRTCGAVLDELDASMEAKARLTLDRHEMVHLLTAIKSPSSMWAPPSCHARRKTWQERIDRALTQGVGQTPSFHVVPADQPSLAALLTDLLMTNCVHDEQGGWQPKDEEQLRHVEALSCWMRDGLQVGEASGAGVDVGREKTGRLLLRQQAGLTRDIRLEHGREPLELPPAMLLDDLMSPTTRAHISITGGPEVVARWGQALQAMPMRSWQLTSTDTLARLMHEQQASVRVLDLTQVGARLSETDLQVLRQALADLPNLQIIRVPGGTPSDALGPDWAAKRCPAGREFTPIHRVDGLSALDEAAAAWQGNYLGTRMALRRKASHKDGQFLLTYARRLATDTAQDPQVGRQLRALLNHCAASDMVLKTSAQMVRDGWLAGEPLPALLARVVSLVGADSEEVRSPTSARDAEVGETWV